MIRRRIARIAGGCCQRGAVSLLAILFLLTVIAAVLATSLIMSSSDIIDSSVQSDSIRALLLADGGVERAAYIYKNSGACDNTGVGAGITPYPLGSGTFTIDSGVALDFANAPLAVDRCRVRVTGRVGSVNVARTVEAIVERGGSILPTSANADFNAPPGSCVYPGCQPTGWLLQPLGSAIGQPWDDSGGPDGSRSAWVSKDNGPTAGTTAGQYTFSPAISVTGPTTLTFTFDYRHEIGEPAPGTMGVTFTLREQAPGTNVWTSAEFLAARAPGYRTGSTTMTITQTGTFTVNQLEFALTAKAGQAKSIRIDNIALEGPGGAGTTSVIAWREPVN